MATMYKIFVTPIDTINNFNVESWIIQSIENGGNNFTNMIKANRVSWIKRLLWRNES